MPQFHRGKQLRLELFYAMVDGKLFKGAVIAERTKQFALGVMPFNFFHFKVYFLRRYMAYLFAMSEC